MYSTEQLQMQVATGKMDVSIAARIRNEQEIIGKIIDAGLTAGYQFDVHDSEETTLRNSTSKAAIEAALMTTDEDALIVRDSEGKRLGFISLIYGNGNHGLDVISDYSISLESPLAPVNAYLESLDAR